MCYNIQWKERETASEERILFLLSDALTDIVWNQSSVIWLK